LIIDGIYNAEHAGPTIPAHHGKPQVLDARERLQRRATGRPS
jgi:hypothetical protein